MDQRWGIGPRKGDRTLVALVLLIPPTPSPVAALPPHFVPSSSLFYLPPSHAGLSGEVLKLVGRHRFPNQHSRQNINYCAITASFIAESTSTGGASPEGGVQKIWPQRRYFFKLYNYFVVFATTRHCDGPSFG